ncbi:MAG: MBOAT family protein [Flavobacteriales bacterium]|jgi:D-alanyl-lipoteichoic acid acyltransferase DltB (MBOAT superfamily)|nr:MBOAT family protein [Flavobacteriales bacterium]MBK7940901.1 MBOAT family protein [Flavobacteriales bacterium]MBK9701676.1 MBOAT family protein [Flavobacteriales bacterium]
MLFNSVHYLWFLPTVFALYWGVFRSLRAQNLLLIVASYVFYGWWDPRFLALLFVSSFSDYWLGLWIDRSGDARVRRRALVLSLVFNLGILAYFKYSNFFIASAVDALHALGLQANIGTLNVILPVGVSFYTFQSISYTIEIYRREMRPVRDPIAYLAFVSFFPHMVAGPIMRAVDLLPQMTASRRFTYANGVSGLRLIVQGLFKKVVIADSLAPMVDQVFRLYPWESGPDLALGAIYFAFQIYGDFSGYSDIAIGSAKLFGIELMTNFRTPYLARDIGDFWKRWHISLSTWFRDFLYIPLGGNRVSRPRRVFNTLVTFIASGFWHGANWTFLAWGAIHGLLYVPLIGKADGPARPAGQARILLSTLLTFAGVTLAWVFFRARNIAEAFGYLKGMCTQDVISVPDRLDGLPFVGVMVLLDLVNRHHVRDPFGQITTRWVRYAVYFTLVLAVVLFSRRNDVQFIYFQF